MVALPAEMRHELRMWPANVTSGGRSLQNETDYSYSHQHMVRLNQHLSSEVRGVIREF